MKKVALIGLGPHSKRIYLNYFEKYNNCEFTMLIDLESNKENVEEYLKTRNFNDVKLFLIPDEYKDNEFLPNDIEDALLVEMKKNEITHIISSTEPKAHNMYLTFALKNNINILSDKPITVVKNMHTEESIEKLKSQYYELLKLYDNSTADCKIMCQRQYHRGYEYIKELLKETIVKYNVPITYIDIYHCDGNWEMAHDMEKENHPYKYGYGKLFHSGYHFIDLLSDFIKLNDYVTEDKKIKSGKMYSTFFTPNDEIQVFNINDYKEMFKDQDIPEYYYNNTNPTFNNYGEKNSSSILNFKNCNGATITTVNLNLLHYGVSRRGWIVSKDFYKKNGRIRHERINIQIGTLLNVQVHSYQSKQIADRTTREEESKFGGLEHFDIDIYRNVDILGGKPFERIQLKDLYSDIEKDKFLGFNEYAREEFVTSFLNGTSVKGDLRDQKLGIEILYNAVKGLKNYHENKEEIFDIKM